MDKKIKETELTINPLPKIVNVDDIQKILNDNRLLQQRIDKAIEFINKNIKWKDSADIYQFCDIESEILFPLRDVLKGDDTNE